jgi:uncharacterized protein
MVIKISELESDVIVGGELDDSLLAEEGEDRFSVSSPVGYDLKVVKYDDRITVKGSVRCELVLTCSRCLEEFCLPVSGEIDVELVSGELMPTATEVELRNADLDVDYYEGDEIDLDTYVREEVLLNIPVRAICGEGCKGLCPSCGANMNKEACQCGRAPQTLLGEKLKSFLTE